MALSVLNNIAAIYAQNNLNQTQGSLQTTLTQLSSGSRINSGADDAAGLSVADGLHANVAALTQSSQNASDGIGLLQTADGALSQVTNLLNRAITLATQAANSTLDTSQVSSANQEYQNILSEIGNIGASTNFNSSNVFSNTARTIFTSDGTSSGSSSYNDVVGTLTTASVGVGAPAAAFAAAPTAATASALGTSSTTTFVAGPGAAFSGTLSTKVNAGTAATLTVAPGTTGTALVAQIAANPAYVAAGITGAYNATTGTLTLSGPAVASSNLDATTSTITATPGVSAGVNFTTSNIATLSATSATTILTSASSAIADVAYQRGIIGADINQLTAASNVASSESVNLTSAESSIRSTNYGAATSDLAKFKVLSSTGISALAQANSVQQEVTKLLQ